LKTVGISEKSVSKAITILKTEEVMRGATIMEGKSGVRLEPDHKRGVRAARIGIDPAIESQLVEKLMVLKMKSDVVKEALILASKVASCPPVIAEVCVSDDPSYTTGYVSARGMGYIRVPNIKREGSLNGGRIFFVQEGSNIHEVIDYLENIPVMVSRLSEFHDTIDPNELIHSLNH
jgi:6-carboxyhexanoate--CoA ligase